MQDCGDACTKRSEFGTEMAWVGLNRWGNEGDAIVVITSNETYGKMTICRGSVRPMTGDDACKLDYDARIRLMIGVTVQKWRRMRLLYE